MELDIRMASPLIERRTKMEGFTKRIEKLFMAITFAEANEFDTARDIMREEERPQKTDRPQLRKEMRVHGLGR